MRNHLSTIRTRNRYGQYMLLVPIAVAILAVGLWACEANQISGRQDNAASNLRRASPSPLKRKIQSWLIRNRSQSRMPATKTRRIKHSFSKRDENRSKKCGSFMTCQSPTKERLYRWFGMEGEEPNQLMRSMMLRNEFNHKIYGITNPFLKILPSRKPCEEKLIDSTAERSCQSSLCNKGKQILTPLSQMESDICSLNTTRYQGTGSTSRTDVQATVVKLGNTIGMESSWWPSLQIGSTNAGGLDDRRKSFNKWKLFHQNKKNNSGSSYRNFNEKDWRIRTYRIRVGRGRDCYEKVRNAALDWEFQSADGSAGMMQVPDNLPYEDKYGREAISIASSGMRRSYSVQPLNTDESDSKNNREAYFSSSSLFRSLGSRRLVSFASKSMIDFLPSYLRQRIYSINPVMVVYDVVDQRAPNGKTTFTSTAFSTLKGHFLSGEERVTVALRDGSQDVEVEILSISRAGPGLFGKTLWPFIGKMQSNFFQHQLDHLSRSGLVTEGDNHEGIDTI